MLRCAWHIRGIVLVSLLLLAGCVSVAPTNQPLAPSQLAPYSGGPISTGGYRVIGERDNQYPSVLVMLAFSGGGKRSSAFGYGVLRGLRDFYVPIDGRQARLLDMVDMMASVSGGTFPAAYYALYRDKIFTDFDKDFLSQDIESYIYGTYLLPWNLGWAFATDYGTNDRMAEIYDKLMFHGATYADLIRAGRPLLSIDATDVDHGVTFPFLQDQFDLICADLTSYPVARAVAASNGFPVIFTPITLKSFRQQCGSRVPGWVSAYAEQDELSRVHHKVESARLYLDGDKTKYVHLMDGGISDNLAMRSMVNIILVLTGETSVGARVDLSHIRRIVMISADGQAANDAATAREQHLSGLGQIFGAVSGTQIDRYNFETMLLARSALDDLRDTVRKQRCDRGATIDSRPCDDVQSYFIHLSLAGVADQATRERLQKIPTGLTLKPEDVAALVAAGEQQVRDSTTLAEFRDNLH
jgi:NTE family protein